MILGLALLTPLALIGAIFDLVHDVMVKTNLFLGAGVARRRPARSLRPPRRALAERPRPSLVFLIPALSLAGLPPLSGFWAKLLLV